jgi:hypothetical protein
VTKEQFRDMLHTLSDAWARHDYPAAAAFFAEDVQYADPLRYHFGSRRDLQYFFAADEGLPQITVWHNILFDEALQVGAAEYTYQGTHVYHGITIVRVQDELISHWREYQHIDPRPWTAFAGTTAFTTDG